MQKKSPAESGQNTEQSAPGVSVPFFICDLRKKWNGNPYVSFWRSENAGYCYPLSWAGRYGYERIRTDVDYYVQRDGRALSRFPIYCHTVELFGAAPVPGIIDGNVGPVIPNSAAMRAFLRRHAFLGFSMDHSVSEPTS